MAGLWSGKSNVNSWMPTALLCTYHN